jgi:hypothetical protein
MKSSEPFRRFIRCSVHENWKSLSFVKAAANGCLNGVKFGDTCYNGTNY